MAPPIRKTKFVPEWIDMGPKIPVPRIDWIKEKILDLPYSDGPLQKMDIYYPNETEQARRQAYPALILVHGGGFIGCDKRDWHLYPGFHSLLEGFVLVSVNYRLAPAHPFPAAVEDLKSAVAYLRQHSGELRLQSENFFLYGTSAGGNLVAYTGLDGSGSRGTERDYHVAAVASLCPLISFGDWMKQAPWWATLHPEVRKMLYGYLGGNPRKRPELAVQASADSRICSPDCCSQDSCPAFYLQHGDRDWGVKPGQSIDFYNKLKASGCFREGDLVLDILKDTPHAGAGPQYLEITNVKPILDFFKQHLTEVSK
jgi:acetyl esterase/lipase